MLIRSIHVKSLFGEYDYSLELCDDLTFLHSPNGFGKSTLMHMLYSALSGDEHYLMQIPFCRLDVCFDGGTCLSIDKKDGCLGITLDASGDSRRLTVSEMAGIRDITYIPPERLMVPTEDGHIVPALATYAQELADRLSEDGGDGGFDEPDLLHQSVAMYLEVINGFFINKTASISEDGKLTVSLRDGTVLPLAYLSSGERQVLIMFYILLFRSVPGSVVILDEPEISLHISWQQRLGDYFVDICRIRDIQMIVATHSPQVIHDKWDLARELKAENA